MFGLKLGTCLMRNGEYAGSATVIHTDTYLFFFGIPSSYVRLWSENSGFLWPKITFLGSLTLTLMSPCKECSRDILRQVCSNPLAFQHYIIYALYSLFVLFLLPGKEPDVAAWRVILLPNPVFNHTQE